MALIDVEAKCLLDVGVDDVLVRIGVDDVLVRRCICT